jgi:predicted RNA-binding Zn ribbon-like protein
LTNYAELLHWAVHAGVLDQSASRRLAKEAERRPREAQAVVASAIELREALARLFLADRRGTAADVAVVNALLAAAPPRSAIRVRGSGFTWGDDPNGEALDDLLHPVVWSAADLATSGQLSNVRSCSDARCGWLFLDASPSGRRRWCSMKECGNRAKVRRHHQAKKAKRKRSRSQ